jgi:small subunit ribosomal protein S21
MIYIKVEDLESALKALKRKFTSNKTVHELRERSSFTKKSVKRRDTLKQAKYRQFKQDQENKEF